MTTLISGAIMIVSAFVFFVSLMVSTMPKTAKVGDIYGHVNPGASNDPNRPSRPFVMIYEVIEVKDGNALTLRRSVNMDGGTIEWESWDSAFGIGKHDQKLSK